MFANDVSHIVTTTQVIVEGWIHVLNQLNEISGNVNSNNNDVIYYYSQQIYDRLASIVLGYVSSSSLSSSSSSSAAAVAVTDNTVVADIDIVEHTRNLARYILKETGRIMKKNQSRMMSYPTPCVGPTVQYVLYCWQCRL